MASPLLDPRIKLRHLLCFLETDRQGGVLQAADTLGLSQPAISKALAELEEILDAELFDRSRRKLALTHQGELFLRHASNAVFALRQGVEMLGHARKGFDVVRFGALPSVEVELLPKALAEFSSSPLACRIHIASGPSAYLLNQLRSGAIDFMIGRMPAPELMSELSFEHLHSETLALAVRPQHPLRDVAQLRPQMIENFPTLVPPRDAIIRKTVESWLLSHDVGRLKQEIETVSNSFSRAYVLTTDAIWFISRSVVEADMRRGDLAALPFNMTTSHGAIGITTRAGYEPDMATAAMMRSIRDMYRNATSLFGIG